MNTPITIRKLISEANGSETLRQLRWPAGVRCPFCGAVEGHCRGHDEVHRGCQRYQCKGCDSRFEALSETVRAGHPQPRPGWRGCRSFRGVTLSNRPIAQELDLHEADVPVMTTARRAGGDNNKPRAATGGGRV